MGSPLRRPLATARAHPELIVLGAIVALGAVVRFATLGVQSFDSGETVTAARILHSSFGDTFTAVATVERSGPLYYALAWAWAHGFGTGEVALRSLSAIFGTVTIALAFGAARELFSRRVGLIAAGLVAVSPDLVWYSQEARSYALFIMLSTGALWLFARCLSRPTRGAYAGWAAVSALALATHYFAVFPIAAEALVLVSRAPRANRRAPLVATAGVALAGIALLPLAIHQEGTGRGNGFAHIPVLERAASSAIKFVAGEGPSTSGEWTAVPLLDRLAGILVLAACLAAVVALVRGARGVERDRARAVGTVAGLSFAAPLALALIGLDYIEPRNLLGSLVPFVVVVAAGLGVALRGHLRGRSLGRAIPAVSALAVSAAMVVTTNVDPVLQRDDWRELSALLARAGRADVIITQPPSAGKPLRYYFGHPLVTLGQTRFPCGVRARTIVTLSRNAPQRLTDNAFRLRSALQTDQGWTVATYRARSDRRVDTAQLRILDVLDGNQSERVDTARRAAPHGECTQPEPAIELQHS